MKENLATEQFNEHLQACVAWAKSVLSDEKHDGFEPALLAIVEPKVHDDAGMILILMQDFNPEKRHLILTRIAEQMVAMEEMVYALFFISEAWLSIEQVEDLSKRKYRMPRDDPGRREVIVVAGMDIEGHSNQATIPIRRTKRNMMQVAGEPELRPYGGEGTPQMVNNLCGRFFIAYRAAALQYINASADKDKAHLN